MILASSDGNCVELRVVGYQFPGHTSDGTDNDWDANWLVVRGKILLADGRTWQFADPCMTTWEAQRLSSWLADVASGAVSPVPPGGVGPQQCEFTEPNIAFSVVAGVDGDTIVRVHFSLESAPPWERSRELFEHFVPMTLPRSAVSDAAQDWRRDLTSYPSR